MTLQGFNGHNPVIEASVFVHKTACIIGDVEIGEKSSVWPGTVIRADFTKIKIGKNVHIEDNTVLHPSMPLQKIGDNVLIGHSAVVEARTIGSNIIIGNNSTILTGVEIGDFCIIGANAMIRQGMKIPAGSFVIGVPAKIKGELGKEQLKMIEDKLSAYAMLVQSYSRQAT